MSKLLSTKEVANLLGINPNTALEYFRSGKITASRIAEKWRVKPEDLDEYINSKRVR